MKMRLLMAGLLALQVHAAAQAQTIQVVTEATSFAYVRDGKVAGPATEIAEATLRGAGLHDFRVMLYPWARAYDLARNEPNVLIYLIARTPARETQFKWVGEVIKMKYHLYKLKERADIMVTGLEQAKRYTVGVTRDDMRHDYLRAKGFSKIVVSAHNIDNFRKLMSGQVQLIPMPETDVVALCQEARFDCSRLERTYNLDELSTGLYLAYGNPTSDAVVERTRAAFQKLKADGSVARVMATRP
ncbi:substrate-binding periplasmic protein [Caldimonas brevitalea]|uniref:ABC transporter substrate-binding protein n=1 Tax=Caldimonas brevitalea TaxID=413882 RepID=A0A0G3BMD1_9BURK|nr:transporter substrate-binding domain-containing protein [Caldimonas brevitalea]AKJ29138.1 ABC transporter substrate-binding protein [Caldimonas brevitalea]